jgi:hypothetical protein
MGCVPKTVAMSSFLLLVHCTLEEERSSEGCRRRREAGGEKQLL